MDNSSNKIKLRHLPKVYYLNLDNRTDRAKYMEDQFEEYGIKNYERISASKFLASEFDDWKGQVFNAHRRVYKDVLQHRVELGTACSYIDFWKTWLKDTDEEYLIMMEDDYDLSYVNYWHFDWTFLMNKIPYDWDCILLGFENFQEIPCYLHPIHPYHDMGPALMHRRYIEKLVDIHITEGKYNFHRDNRNFMWSAKKDWNVSFMHPETNKHVIASGVARPTPSTADYFFGHCGNTYCLPLISVNPDLGSYETDKLRDDREDLTFTRRAYDLWWKRLRDNYSVESFFTYGKPYDFRITRDNINHFIQANK